MAKVMGSVATGNSSVLITDGSGNPSFATALPSGITATTQIAGTNNTTVSTTAYADSAATTAASGKITGTTTQYDVIVGAGTNSVGSVGPGSAGQVLQSGGNAANPAYSTATYPATATSTGTLLRASGTNWVPTTATYPGASVGAGKILRDNGTNFVTSTATYPDTATGTGTILRADGTNWSATTATYPATTTINQLLYSSSANTIGGLATANSSVLVTDSGGIPSLSSTLPTVTIPTVNGPTTISGNTNGDLTLNISNSSAGASADSRLELSTGTGNSYVLFQLNDNAGSPSCAIAFGPALSGAFTLPKISSPSINFGGSTLANYVEGSWTPGISFGGGTTGITYSTQTGRYTRIGNLVYIEGAIILSNKGSSTGAIQITGLPVTSGTAASAFNIGINYFGGITFPANFTSLSAFVDSAATTASLYVAGSGQSPGAASTANCTITNSLAIYINGFYTTSA